MKRDIRINYSVLEGICGKIKKYKVAIETIHEVLNTVNRKLEEENQGKAITALKEMYIELKGDLEECQEEVNDLYTILYRYIGEMQDIIRPINSSNMMQVDRNDIWWNMESIFGACTAVGLIKMNVGTYGGLPNPFINDEDSANEEKNRRKMEEIWNEIKNCGNKLKENADDLQYIYDNKIIPYEDKDDEYKTKAGKLHSKYTNTWERLVELTKGYDTIKANIERGVVDSLVGLVKGVGGLVKGILIYEGADIGIRIKLITGDTPDCLQYCIDKADEYDKTIVAVFKDPTLIVEGISQGVSDAVEEKGVAYCCGYVAGEIIQTILITKGLDKVKELSKVEKVVTKVEPEISRLEYLRNKYGKLSPEELHERINIRGMNEEAIKELAEVVSKLGYKADYANHLKNVIGKLNRDVTKGITGGHNMDEFMKYFREIEGLTDKDFIESSTSLEKLTNNPAYKGIYEIKYKIPKLERNVDGKLVPTGEYKVFQKSKTVYDPSVISDYQMLQWGEEAIKNGIINKSIQGNKVIGTASNGLKFEGWINREVSDHIEITNFYPIRE